MAVKFKRTKKPGTTKKKIRRILSSPENQRLVKAERCRRDFAYFMRTMWECVSSDDLVWNWHLDYLTEQLSDLARNVSEWKPKEHDMIINIPPGTTKSITCSVMFPVWCWINWHWMRFIASSYSGSLALEHAENSRELVRHEKFKWLFPEIQIKQDKDQKSNFRVQKVLPDGEVVLGGNRYSTSVGGTLTGYHAHILLVDDPLDPKRSVSDVERQSANRWIDQTLSTRKIDKEVTPTVLIMQRLHEDDPTGHTLAKEGKEIFHICLPGELDNYGDMVKPVELKNRYVDGMLDPKRLSRRALSGLEVDLGQYGYAGQIGQNPVPAGGGMFDTDMFIITNTMPPEVDIVASVRYWDKAGTDKKDNPAAAHTSGTLMHRLKDGRFLIEDVQRGQWGTDKRENKIEQGANRDGHGTTIYVEQEPGSGGKESAQNTIRRLAGFSVYADRPTGDKIYRADPYSVQVNNGNVLLLRGEWNKKFIDEHRHFPFGKFKDQVDSASGAFTKVSGKKEAGSVFRKKR